MQRLVFLEMLIGVSGKCSLDIGSCFSSSTALVCDGRTFNRGSGQGSGGLKVQIPGGVQLHNYWGRVLVQICGEVSEGSGACARVSLRCSFIQVFERFDSYGFLAVNGGGLFILGSPPAR